MLPKEMTLNLEQWLLCPNNLHLESLIAEMNRILSCILSSSQREKGLLTRFWNNQHNTPAITPSLILFLLQHYMYSPILQMGILTLR